MNIVAKTDLTFQNFTFNPIVEDGQVWLTSAEIAKALEYKSTDAISQIYARNADEFNSSMTTTLKMKVVRKTGSVDMMNRLFTLRGAHLLAMFAKTTVAKLFRKWVLDILDREVTKSKAEVMKKAKPEKQYRYLIDIKIHDTELKDTHEFLGKATTPENIIHGLARRYGYAIERMLSLPPNCI
ncbi:Bro-N domain-containing protein [Providencia rettgeri]